MNPWIHSMIYTLLFWAQSTIKNPKSVEKERVLLQEVYDALGQLLAAIPQPTTTKSK